MNFLSSNLKYLRGERRLSQQKLADIIGIRQRMYSFYETGQAQPNLETLIKLSDFYGKNIDVLVRVNIKADFISNLKYLRKSNSLSQRQIAESIGIKQTTYSDYERGRSEPTLEILKKLAIFYKISIDNLVGFSLT